MSGHGRAIRNDERESWSLCPLEPDDAEAPRWLLAERDWLDGRHPTTRNAFAFVDGESFLGKYDVPFESPGGWRMWAPTVRGGSGEVGVMKALVRHAILESARREVPAVEVILEGSHRNFELARRVLLEVGFRLIEHRALVRFDLRRRLPPIPASGLRFSSASELPRSHFLDLCSQVGMSDSDIRELHEGSGDHPLWIFAASGQGPIGLSLMEWSDKDRREVTIRHIGVVPEARRRGHGRVLFLRSLQGAREAGAELYLDSTPEQNIPMLALFGAIGCEVFGKRLILLYRHREHRSEPGNS